MHAHEQRVVDEKRELDERLIKLVEFIATSPVFRGLGEIDQKLMQNQRQAMMLYSNALEDRISRFMA